MAAIINSGTSYIAQRQAASEAVEITEFILANIDGLDHEQPVNLDEALPDANNIVWQSAVTQAGYVAENKVVYSLQLDSTIGDFTFNWMGLVASDGTLIAVSYLPAVLKTKTDGGVSGNNITRNFLLEFADATLSTEITVDASTWQINYTARLKGIDERIRLGNFDLFGRQTFFNAAFRLVGNGSDVEATAGTGWIAGIRLEIENNQVVSIDASSTDVYIDVAMIPDANDINAEFTIFSDATEQTDYIDGVGIQHYVEKIASLDEEGNITDLRFELNMPNSIAEFLTTLANNNHGHSIEQIEGLAESLDAKADANHDHGSDYATGDHNHDSEYAAAGHNHDSSYAATNHNHDSEYAAVNHNHDSSYAAANHNHDSEYAAANHNHDSSYAAENHNHDSDYAAASHNHDSSYAAANHNHDSVYAKLEDIPNVVFTELKEVPGYVQLPNGIIIQWGQVPNITAGQTYGGVFPIAFPTICASIASCVFDLSITEDRAAVSAYSAPNFPANFTLRHSGNSPHNLSWIAIGY